MEKNNTELLKLGEKVKAKLLDNMLAAPNQKNKKANFLTGRLSMTLTLTTILQS